MGIPLPHGATSQQPQLERPGGPHHEDCGRTQQRRDQQVETERNTPVNPKERGIGGVQVLQDEDQNDHQGDEGERNEGP